MKLEKLNELKKTKGYKITTLILKILLAVFIIGFVLVVALQRFSNNRLSVFDFRMFTVVTGSMEPKYNIGDVLIAKKIKPEDVKVGDAVSYEGKSHSFKGKVITHEVVEIQKPKLPTDKYQFKTKGLTNLIEDPIIDEDQLYGVIVYRSFLLSLLYSFINTSLGFYILIIIPIMFIVGSEILSFMLKREEKLRQNN